MKKRLDYIDASRGVAIFGVLIVHSLSFLIKDVPGFVGSIIANGARGVQLFFVISAFTLFLSIETKRNEQHRTLNYFIRRFFRIAPLFYVVVFYAVFPEIKGIAHRFSFAEILSTLIFVNGWHPKWINSVLSVNWTIAVEMSFYILVPLLFKKIKNLSSAVIFALSSSIVLNLITYFLLSHPLWNVRYDWVIFLHTWLPSQLPIFALGIVLYFLIYPENQESNSKVTNRNALFIMFAWLLGSLSLFSDWTLANVNQYGLLSLFLIFFLSQYPIKIFVNRFWIYLGKISFSVYLTHLFVLSFVKDKIFSYFELGGLQRKLLRCFCQLCCYL